MRILLDECVPVRLARDLAPHEVSSVRRRGWTSLADGELLRLAAGEFDAFLTVDQSLEHQQAVPINLILVTVESRSIEYPVLQALVSHLVDSLENATPGQAIRIRAQR